MFFGIILRRLLLAIPTALILSFAVFTLVKLIPGDAARLALGEKATQQALEDFRQEMGLDRSFPVQYGIFLRKLVLDLDLGTSIRSGEEVSKIIREKFPATFELACAALLFALLVGVPLGFLAALKPGSPLDLALMGVSVVGVSMPVFWLGLLLMWYLGLETGLFPLSGRMGIEFEYQPLSGLLLFDSLIRRDWVLLSSGLQHLCLPALTLGTIPLAFLARMTRSSMLDVMQQDFIRTARAKGLKKVWIYVSHAFRNAAIPVVNIAGLQFGVLLAGAMITETIFSWPGMGRWILESVHARDIPAIEGGVLVVAMSFVAISLAVDLSFKLLDARVKIS